MLNYQPNQYLKNDWILTMQVIHLIQVIDLKVNRHLL